MEVLSRYNWIGVGVFVGAIIIAHLFTSPPYDWRNNTISELASQHYTYRWIMKIGFILFGAILALGITHKLLNGNGRPILEVPMMIYGLAILVSGLYSTKPFISDIPYSVIESNIHSYAAQIAGLSFSVGLLLFGLMEENTNLKLIHFSAFAFVIGCSALFGLMNGNIGIIQRVMYLGSFIWLVAFYK